MQDSRHATERDLGIDILLAFPLERTKRQITALLGHESRDIRYRALQKLIGEQKEERSYRQRRAAISKRCLKTATSVFAYAALSDCRRNRMPS